VKRAKQEPLTFSPALARTQEAALLAIGHLEMAVGFIDIVERDLGPLVADRDLGTDALGMASTVRNWMIKLKFGDVKP
jgi:hypothetical protein